MLGIHPALVISLCICGALLVVVVFEEYLTKFLKRGVLGCATILVVDLVMPSSLVLGWSLWTVLGACLLGIPGVVLMYVLKVFSTF